MDLIERVLADASVVPGAEGAAGEATRKGPEAARDDLRTLRLLTEAERIAHSLTDEDEKAAALSRVASALAATAPDHAAQLLTEAERIAGSITEVEKAWALTVVAEALAAI